MTTTTDDYIKNYLLARGELMYAKFLLEDMTTDATLTETQQANAMVAFLSMSDEIAALDQAHNAVKAEFNIGVNPPSDQLVADSLRIAADLGKVISKAKTAQAILDAATAITDAWTKLAA